MEHNASTPWVQKRTTQLQRLDITNKHCLAQVVNIPTREDKILDLFLTNCPGPVSRVKELTLIGKADHAIQYVEYDIKAKRIKQTPRKIFLSKRADRDGLRDHMAQFKDEFLSSAHKNTSVNEMWVNFKT